MANKKLSCTLPQIACAYNTWEGYSLIRLSGEPGKDTYFFVRRNAKHDDGTDNWGHPGRMEGNPVCS